MKTKHAEQAFISVPVILLFTAIGLMLITSMVGRMTFLSRQTHRILLSKQAQALANGAIERALDALSSPDAPNPTSAQEYTENIAPIYIGDDPIGEPEDDLRVIRATYGYRCQSVEKTDYVNLPIEQIQNAFLITGYAEIPYRNTTLSSAVTKLCVLDNKNEWTLIPMIDDLS
ncbi:MAG: hypothetical protein C4527_27180 [Candidatus Omnitrophota bacterium]|jgi:hypothetical protein|nr:MAG: hypothetical protein C4527_27180 [Candidatus Omnitrophota bacterium]